MIKPYDNGTRRLMAICAQDFLEWLLPGAFFTGKLSEKFESFEIEAPPIVCVISIREKR